MSDDANVNQALADFPQGKPRISNAELVAVGKECLAGADPFKRDNLQTALARMQVKYPEHFDALSDNVMQGKLSGSGYMQKYQHWIAPMDEDREYAARKEYERSTKWDDGSRTGYAPTRQFGPYRDPQNLDRNINPKGWV